MLIDYFNRGTYRECGDSIYSLARIVSAGPARLSLRGVAVSEVKGVICKITTVVSL